MTFLLTLGVFAGALIAAAWAIYVTVAPRVGQILDALCGRPQPETWEQRWRRVHLAADRNQEPIR